MLPGVLDRSKLKHDPKTIAKLYTDRGDSIVANDDFYIVFPERYINKRLAIMGGTVKLLSIYAIVTKSLKYGVISAPAYVDITPNNVTTVIIDGVVNKVLEINKDSVFIPDRNLLKVAIFMYDLFDEFLLQGKIPWYITYERLADLFADAGKYAGSGIGNDPLAMEIITSIVSRSSKDKLINYRNVLKAKDINSQPSYVGLNNVYYSYDNTLSKVMGGYMQQGVSTAIVNKETESNKVSRLIRS